MQKSGDLDEKENHIGYYLISKGQEKLYKDLGIKKHTREDISYLNFEKKNTIFSIIKWIKRNSKIFCYIYLVSKIL